MSKKAYEFTNQSIQQRFEVNSTKSQRFHRTLKFNTQQASHFLKIVWSTKSYPINLKLNRDKLLYVLYVPSKIQLKIIFL